MAMLLENIDKREGALLVFPVPAFAQLFFAESERDKDIPKRYFLILTQIHEAEGFVEAVDLMQLFHDTFAEIRAEQQFPERRG